MSRRFIPLAVAALLALPFGSAVADEDKRTPVPEGGVVEYLPGASCHTESRWDTPTGGSDGRSGYYGTDCRRMRIVFGPISVKPGQNDVLIQPVTYEKPQYDGYMVRFKPDLIDPSGVAPPVEDLHLHHGTWLNVERDAAGTRVGRSYGAGPWLASGEEKTIASWPESYGVLIRRDDPWLFLHMVHNATPVPRVVWVTYDIDYVKKDVAETKYGMKNTKQIWLDVGGGRFHERTQNYPLNPVYNVQKGFGSIDPETGARTCTWPLENCARYNSLGNTSAQQGVDVSGQPDINKNPLRGKDFKIDDSLLDGTGKGTLVVMGGHVHTGGIRDEVSLVRDVDADGVYEAEEERLIHVSDAYYWNATDSSKVGAAPSSWDFSMTGTTKDLGWAINVQKGDILRLNAVYDSELASWYENMGIVMTWVAPGEQTGVDPFAPGVQSHRGIASTALARDLIPEAAAGWRVPGAMHGVCEPSSTTICVRGAVTHPHYETSGNHGNCATRANLCPPLPTTSGPSISDVPISAFTYGPADLGTIRLGGIPTVKKGQPLTFWNLDAGSYIWHTVTSCELPCTGPTTVDYPIADNGLGPDDEMAFDSSELGYGLGAANRATWTFKPTRPGTFAFYCRIHPGMRGAFRVVE